MKKQLYIVIGITVSAVLIAGLLLCCFGLKKTRYTAPLETKQEETIPPASLEEPKEDVSASDKEQALEDHTFAIYVSGIDSFGAATVKGKSDVNVIAFINDMTHQILLVNTPRDYYVNTPVSGEYKDRLTYAGLWGPECSMGALADLYDCDIDYFFRINFSGFENVIDALGGIDYYFAKGYPAVHLNGEDALLVARDRTTLGSETDRGIRHMQFITAIINKALSTDVLYNYNNLLDAVSESFNTSVPYDLISKLAKIQIENNPSWEIITYAVTGKPDSAPCFSFLTYDDQGSVQVYVLEPDLETVQTARDLIASMERNETVYLPD